MKSEYKEEYKNYLMILSKGIKSEIYSHYDTDNILVLEKARIMIIVWSEDIDNVLTYDEFVTKQRDNKLSEIGI